MSPHDHRPTPPRDELVERLLRLADTGPEIPDDGAARVKNAIRPLWHEQVRARRRTHRLWWAAGLAAAASVVVAIALVGRPDRAPGPSVAPVATLELIHGTLQHTPPSGAARSYDTADLDTTVEPGSWLSTDSTSRAALRLAGDVSLRLDRETRVRLETGDTLTLDRGAAYVDSRNGGGSAVEIRTRLGVARDIGTQFEVRCEGDRLTVAVRQGMVELMSGGDDLRIGGGSALTVAADGSRLARATSASGPEWAWTQEVAPFLDIEGRSVMAFLDWVSRETGLWIRFADREVEQAATTTLLHGTIEGLAPSEAAKVVLPGCGLTATRSDGTLLVSRIPPADGRP
jgi:ferric-dicitrate binding protein FerR (iron transport regulator)